MLADHGSLIAAWNQRVAATPEARALVCEDGTWTYRALDLRIRAHAGWLRSRGIGAGDRVLLLLDNGAPFLSVFLGCQRLGAVPVPLSPRSTSRRVAHVARDCAASLVLSQDRRAVRDMAEGPTLTTLPVDWSAEDEAPEVVQHLALIQYTSGSTAESKGVLVSQRAVLTNIDGFTAVMDLGPDSCFSSLMPLFHDMGLVCFGLAPLLLGHPLILYRQEALSLYQWLEGIATHRVTHTGGPDSLLRIACRVVDAPGRYDLSSLRMFICGSEPILKGTLEAFGARFSARDILRPAYGMAELTLCVTITPASEPWRRDSCGHVSSGRPIAGVEIRTKPEKLGEIWVKSPSLMDGYWRSPTGPELDEDGFFPTGDLGQLDEDGHLYVLGRLKNLIIRAGAKFNPHELEAAAQKEGLARRAAVVQPSLGQDAEDPVVVVLEVDRLRLKDAEAMERLAREVRKRCASEAGLAPDWIWCVSAGRLPTTENGKMQHRALAEAIRSGAFRPAWSMPTFPHPVSVHRDL